MEDADIKEFLSSCAIQKNFEKELKEKVRSFSTEQKHKKNNASNTMMGFILKPSFAVMHRKQNYNADAMDFITRYFSNKGLKVDIENVDAGTDAEELIQLLEKEKKLRHNIVVKTFADIPKKHYQYLLDNNYSVIVLDRLDINNLEHSDNYLEQGPLLKHVRLNTYEMMQYIMKREIATAGNNEANQQKAEEAAKKYKKTYDVLTQVLKSEGLKKGKILTQGELVTYFRENKVLDWEVSQSLISRCIRKTGNYSNWKQLIKEIKGHIETSQFKFVTNGKTEKDVVGFIVDRALKSPNKSISLPEVFTYMFDHRMPADGRSKAMDRLMDMLNVYCINNDLPIVTTLIGLTEGTCREVVLKGRHDFYVQNGGQIVFENEEEFHQFFKDLSMEFGLGIMARLPDFEM